MKRLCKIRDLQHTITSLEHSFNNKYGICFNEGALLCLLSEKEEPLTSGEISELLNLSHSNASKVISSAEDKGYIHRELGHHDKRNMYFNITTDGKNLMESIDYSILNIDEL